MAITPTRGIAILGLWLALAAGAACSGRGGAPADDGAVGPHEGYHHPMVGRAAPDFVGEAPVGGWLPLVNLRGKPIALLIFKPSAPFARELVMAIGAHRNDPEVVPTVFLGVATDTMENLKRFSAESRDALPTLRDPGTIALSYGVGETPALILLDSKRFVRYRLDGFAGARFRDRVAAALEAIRKLPSLGSGEAPNVAIEYTTRPRAPMVTGRDLDGHPVDRSESKGQVLALVFFDQECPHCQRDLPRLAQAVRALRGRGVRALGVSSRDLDGKMRAFLREHDVDFPVVIDPDRENFRRFASTNTPDLFIIDREGYVRFREHGDRPDRAEITALQLRLALGDDPKALAALLPMGRYVGDGVCAACHEREQRDWLMTPHSIAWDSLAQGDKFRDPECVRCHVTGMGQPGGFVAPETTLQMVNIQCEVCHGMAGGHAAGKSAAGVDPEAMGKVCVSCHTGKFVLNFSLDEALPLVAHQDHPNLDRLFEYSPDQRQRMEAINTRRLEKFKAGVDYVGAEVCRDCHRKEYDQWRTTPHASAFTRLIKEERGGDPTCQPCHTTGFAQRRGFGDDMQQASMTNVQCEVCHGPGDDHVKAPANLKKETIYGITDQCSFCIIQGVCATCHDAKNDPHFSIEAALPRVKH
jgi:peroxiredoxin